MLHKQQTRIPAKIILGIQQNFVIVLFVIYGMLKSFYAFIYLKYNKWYLCKWSSYFLVQNPVFISLKDITAKSDQYYQ